MMYKKPLFLLIVLASFCGTGCAGIDSFWESKPAYPMASKERPASQIIAMWQPARGTHHGRPARGFAGNIMFFTARSAMPALVNGTVRVYLFEDQGSPEDQAKPIRQYDFPAEVWNTYAQMSKIGPTYTVFIPYPKAGRHEAKCTLALRLIPEDGGPPLFSEEAQVTLDGTRPSSDNLVNTSRPKRSATETTVVETVKQSYKIDQRTVVPEKIQQAAATTDRAAGIRTADAASLADVPEEEVIRRVVYDSAADRQVAEQRTAKPAVDRVRLDELRARAREKKPVSRNRAKELLETMESTEIVENGEDLARIEEEPSDDDFDRVVRSRRRNEPAAHPLAGDDDVITVDMSALQVAEDTRHSRSERVSRQQPSRQTRRHPLTTDEPADVHHSAADLLGDDDYEDVDDEVLPLNP